MIQPPCPAADHFSILGVPRTFDLEAGTLDTALKRLQAAAHPDRYARASPSERAHSAELSARVNAAYAVLKSPLLRAQYLLGGTVDGDDLDDTTHTDPALLMEVMEAREAVDAAPAGSPELGDLKAEWADKGKKLVAELSAAFRAGDTAAAADAVVRLRYVTRIQQAIADKE